jgi:diaminopimelate epimerase
MIWTRWSGAGNTFYIADSWTGGWNCSESLRSNYAKKICNLFTLAPTDGLLYIEPCDNYDFKWDFYNSDGSRAEMCGNAARCAAQYFFKRIKEKNEIEFLTLAGPIGARILDSSQVAVRMPKQTEHPSFINEIFYINTGVPHLVVEGNPDIARARSLRPLPGPRGSNVTFVTKLGRNTCEACTFERGVENFTAACGTGAVAAALYLKNKFQIDSLEANQYQIQMPGGLLQVENASFNSSPLLLGPVEHCYDLSYQGEQV